ncbi:hypothetical protein BDW_12395 [Bdellovibrio bacteriovorus W]|nr:hypothetical protein BDW_12395 [Bdellovibrio bacteriovorus W]
MTKGWRSLLSAVVLSFAIFTTSTPIASAKGLDGLAPANLLEKIKKEIAKQEIGSSVSLVNAEILSGLTTSLRYKIESEPSYIGGYYNRIDKYSLKIDLRPGDFIDALDTPVGINLQKGSEITFVRQFKSQKDSLLSLPYTPANLPFTAEKALDKLNPGDFVAFEGHLSLVVSMGHSFFQGVLDAGASTHALVSGNFMVHIFRMVDNQVRVKLIGVRGKGIGAGAGIELGEDLSFIGLNIIDRRIEKLLNITPLRLNAGINNKDVFMLDYVFNLNDALAREAYNQLLLYKVQLKDVKIANPFATRKDLMDELMTDLNLVEELSLEDAQIPAPLRRVHRVFKGSTEVDTKESSMRFGLSLWKFQAGRAYAENKVLNYDSSDRQEHFLLNTFSSYKKTKVLFGLFGEESLTTSNLLFTADPNWSAGRFVTLTSSNQMKMKDVSDRDLRRIQKTVLETIGHKAYAGIDWTPWTSIPGKKVNAYFKQEVFFNPEALIVLPHLKAVSLAARFERYIERKGRPQASALFDPGHTAGYFLGGWIHEFKGDFRKIGESLETVIRQDKSIDDRYEAFETLHKIPVWRERGIGFLMDFFTEEQRSKVLRYELVLSAQGVTGVNHVFGNFKEERLYKSLMYIQNIIHNRSFDLRMYADENGELRTLQQAN